MRYWSENKHLQKEFFDKIAEEHNFHPTEQAEQWVNVDPQVIVHRPVRCYINTAQHNTPHYTTPSTQVTHNTQTTQCKKHK